MRQPPKEFPLIPSAFFILENVQQLRSSCLLCGSFIGQRFLGLSMDIRVRKMRRVPKAKALKSNAFHRFEFMTTLTSDFNNKYQPSFHVVLGRLFFSGMSDLYWNTKNPLGARAVLFPDTKNNPSGACWLN